MFGETQGRHGGIINSSLVVQVDDQMDRARAGKHQETI